METVVSRLLHSVDVRNPTNRTRVGATLGAGLRHIETLSVIEAMQCRPPVAFGCCDMVGRKRMAFAQ